MRNNELALSWLKRANSNLIRSKSISGGEGVFLEDSCFDAQQCVEKSFKALCINHDIEFPQTHSISYLISLLINSGIKIPKKIMNSAQLSDYSVETRYPGDYDEVTFEEYNEVVKIADDVYSWVKSKINP